MGMERKMSLSLDFIIKRNADKFISDTEHDLWKYRDFLREEDSNEAKKKLAAVNKALGVSEEKELSPSKRKISKEESYIRKKALEAIKEHFDFD